MTFLRVVTAVLVLGSSLATAQQKSDTEQSQNSPFSLFPERPTVHFPDSNAITSFKPDLPRQFAETAKSLAGDSMCYVISSYVMARDEKDSDSTHLVAYSNCQPSNRYRLKSAEMQGPGAELKMAPE